MKFSIVAFVIALPLAACGSEASPSDASDGPDPNVIHVGGYWHVVKTCDAGRAVYITHSDYSGDGGNIFVVPEAPECAPRDFLREAP